MKRTPRERPEETVKEIRIPFQGFSDTMHSGRIESELDGFFSDGDGGGHSDLMDRLDEEDVIDTGWVETMYAQEYCKAFKKSYAAETLPSLAFVRLNWDTPRESIVATVSPEDLTALVLATPEYMLRKVAGDRHKAQDAANEWRFSGPIPVPYERDIDQWPDDVMQWNPDQVEALLIAHMMDRGVTVDEFREWEMDFCDNDAPDNMWDWINRSIRNQEAWDEIVAERDRRVNAWMESSRRRREAATAAPGAE